MAEFRMLTTKLCKHPRIWDHMFQAQLVLLRDFIKVQKACLGQPLFQELLAGFSWGVGHVPTGVDEDRVLNDIRGVYEKWCNMLRGEQARRDGSSYQSAAA
jgi:hypothetical protein